MFYFLFYYEQKHRPCEALKAMLPPPGTLELIQSRAFASWSCIVDAIVTITASYNDSADTMAITANVLLLLLLLLLLLFTSKPKKVR
jgi:hypothetical protein